MSIGAQHVYVHVPFCARRCSYCDFSIAVRRVVPVSEFIGALRAELRNRFGGADGPMPIQTLYFGGGTPSHLGVSGVEQLVAVMREFFSWDHAQTEVTLEANPDDVSPASAAAWLSAGITRISLGAQSFDPRVLSWMHRTHTSAQIHTAVDAIRATGFSSWSFDLIFALPAELARQWGRDLELALNATPPHLSLYGLTVEKGTPLGRWTERGEVDPASEQVYEHEFLLAHTEAMRAGLAHYEVSNFARPGHAARHNRSYWAGVPYLGVGPAAHGFDGHARRWNISAYTAWRDAVVAGRDPIAGAERIGPSEAEIEGVYLGLRTTAGLALSAEQARVTAPWIDAGWAESVGGRLRLTPLGWLRLDSLVAALTPAMTSP